MKIQRILNWQWHSFLKTGTERALKALVPEVTGFFYQMEDWEKDERFCEAFLAALRKEPFDAVFSVNFNPLISAICQEQGVPYLSWVYDAPIHIRDLSPLKNEVNRTFFFDRGEAESLRNEGYPVQYLPLAGDAETFRKTIEKAAASDRLKYRSEIALVGQLYQTEYNYYMGPLTPYQRGFLEGIVNAQGKVYGGYFLPELVTKELLDGLNERYHAASGGTASITERELTYLLAQEITGRERLTALSLLGRRFPVELYSPNQDDRLPKRIEGQETGVRSHPYVDYYGIMPQVFAGAKINLNISLKCIRSGVPLRVFDVLSCGGFLLTDFQAELPELFEPGEELVCYQSMEELLALSDFYLRHEEERRRIAENGKRRILSDYTPEKQMKKILEKV